MKMKILFGCCGLLLGIVVGQTGVLGRASADLKAQGSSSVGSCDLTFLVDGGQPGIGKEGEIKYDEKWAKLVTNGWRLKTTTGEVYMFEKCR